MIEIVTSANGLMTADVTPSGMVIIDWCDSRMIFHQHEWEKLVCDIDAMMPRPVEEAKKR